MKEDSGKEGEGEEDGVERKERGKDIKWEGEDRE